MPAARRSSSKKASASSNGNSNGSTSATKKASRKPRAPPTLGMKLIAATFVLIMAGTAYVMAVPWNQTIFARVHPQLDAFAAECVRKISAFDFRANSDASYFSSFNLTVGAGAVYATIINIYLYFHGKSKAKQAAQRAEGKEVVKAPYPAWVYPVGIVHHGFLAVLSLVMCMGYWRTFFVDVCFKQGWEVCLNLHPNVVNSETGAVSVATSASTELWMGASAFYMFLFTVSKYYELLDTTIHMGKGYDIILLHWWHHASVPFLMYVHGIEHSSASWTGSWFNCLVHTVMYSYYCLSSIGFSLNSIRPVVTLLQLTQFMTVLGHIGWLQYVNGYDTHPKTFTAAYTVYGSYLLLFINFFAQQYVKKPKKKTA